MPAPRKPRFEWPTLALFCVTFGAWALALFALPSLSLALSVALAALAIAFFASLQHEAIHGHPTAWRWLNTAIASPALTLVVPYLRFRDTHLDHHVNTRLTDPYDDPESHFLALADHARLPRWLQRLLDLNNRLAGRLLLGPALGALGFLGAEVRRLRSGHRKVLWGWLWHLPHLAAVVWVILQAPMPLWAYLIATYAALSLLNLRTFLEHQAHEHAAARSVIIEDKGPLAVLFLHNNLHVVHHMHPDVPWYHLPGLYRNNRARFLNRNKGYVYTSYAEVMRRYFWRAKDPVVHPLWHRDPPGQGPAG